MPHSSHGMKTIKSMRMKSGAAGPAAESRMTPTSNPAPQKMRSERHYLARLMRPLAPNRNSNSSSIAFQHASAPTKPGAQASVVMKPWGVKPRHSDGRILGVIFASGPRTGRSYILWMHLSKSATPRLEWNHLKLSFSHCDRQNAVLKLALPEPSSAAIDGSKRLFRHDLSLI
jgi:hypothetical protein